MTKKNDDMPVISGGDEKAQDTVKKMVVRFTHEDTGPVDVDPNRLSDVVICERELGRPFVHESTEDLMRLAWMKAGHPGGTSDEAFLAWIDGIENTEQVFVPRPTKASRNSTEA